MAPAPRPLPRAAPTPPLLACAPRAHSGRLGPQGRPSRWVPALTLHPHARVAPARGTQAGGPPPASPRGRHAPSPLAARAARPLGREVASPHAGRSGEGARVSARRPGPRPLGCGSAPTAGGGALLGAGSSRRGFPQGPGRGSRGDWGGGGERGLGRKGERGRKGGNQTRKGRKGGRGKIRRGRKAQSPPPAAACALRQHVRRNRQRVLRPARPCFLCACLHCCRRPLPSHPLAPTTHALSSSHTRTRRHTRSLAPSLRPLSQASNPEPLRSAVHLKSIKPVGFTEDLNSTNCRRVI